jgi:hypothetical protein
MHQQERDDDQNQKRRNSDGKALEDVTEQEARAPNTGFVGV